MGASSAGALGAHLASKIFHGGLEAAASVRDAQRPSAISIAPSTPNTIGALT